VGVNEHSTRWSGHVDGESATTTRSIRSIVSVSVMRTSAVVATAYNTTSKTSLDSSIYPSSLYATLYSTLYPTLYPTLLNSTMSTTFGAARLYPTLSAANIFTLGSCVVSALINHLTTSGRLRLYGTPAVNFGRASLDHSTSWRGKTLYRGE